MAGTTLNAADHAIKFNVGVAMAVVCRIAIDVVVLVDMAVEYIIIVII